MYFENKCSTKYIGFHLWNCNPPNNDNHITASNVLPLGLQLIMECFFTGTEKNTPHLHFKKSFRCTFLMPDIHRPNFKTFNLTLNSINYDQLEISVYAVNINSLQNSKYPPLQSHSILLSISSFLSKVQYT